MEEEAEGGWDKRKSEHREKAGLEGVVVINLIHERKEPEAYDY